MMRGSQQMMACEQSDYLASHISISFLFHIQIKQEYDDRARPDTLILDSEKANVDNLFPCRKSQPGIFMFKWRLDTLNKERLTGTADI